VRGYEPLKPANLSVTNCSNDSVSAQLLRTRSVIGESQSTGATVSQEKRDPMSRKFWIRFVEKESNTENPL
jgi:hypothetical protein